MEGVPQAGPLPQGEYLRCLRRPFRRDHREDRRFALGSLDFEEPSSLVRVRFSNNGGITFLRGEVHPDYQTKNGGAPSRLHRFAAFRRPTDREHESQ